MYRRDVIQSELYVQIHQVGYGMCDYTTTFHCPKCWRLWQNQGSTRAEARGSHITPSVCAMYGILLQDHEWVATQQNFRFHTKCKSLRLNHLCFADDMLIFSKGDLESVLLMLRGLKTFSMASGLTTNASKSSIF